jgi:hypothetical protein
MMPVGARITYVLSEQGRRDSLRKGGNGRRVQQVSGAVPDADLDAFIVNENGDVSFDASREFGIFDAESDIALPQGKAAWSQVAEDRDLDVCIEWHQVPTWNDLLDIARKLRDAKREQADLVQQQEDERKRAASQFMNDPAARATQLENNYVVIGDRRFDEKNDPLVVREARRRVAADRNEALREWIIRNGTENQQQRLAAHFLPVEEAYESVENKFYAPLVSFPLYERFDPGRVCRCSLDFGEHCKIKFQAVDGRQLTAEEWDQYAAIQAVATGATLQVREHTAECESGYTEMKRGVIVKFTLGPVTFKREYALTGVTA